MKNFILQLRALKSPSNAFEGDEIQGQSQRNHTKHDGAAEGRATILTFFVFGFGPGFHSKAQRTVSWDKIAL